MALANLHAGPPGRSTKALTITVGAFVVSSPGVVAPGWVLILPLSEAERILGPDAQSSGPHDFPEAPQTHHGHAASMRSGILLGRDVNAGRFSPRRTPTTSVPQASG